MFFVLLLLLEGPQRHHGGPRRRLQGSRQFRGHGVTAPRGLTLRRDRLLNGCGRGDGRCGSGGVWERGIALLDDRFRDRATGWRGGWGDERRAARRRRRLTWIWKGRRRRGSRPGWGGGGGGGGRRRGGRVLRRIPGWGGRRYGNDTPGCGGRRGSWGWVRGVSVVGRGRVMGRSRDDHLWVGDMGDTRWGNVLA